MFLAAVLFTTSGIGCAISGGFSELVMYRILGGIGIELSPSFHRYTFLKYLSLNIAEG